MGRSSLRAGPALAPPPPQVQPYDVIVCDLRRPELDGPAFYGVPAASVQKMPRSLPAGEVKAFRGLFRWNTVRKVARIPRR